MALSEEKIRAYTKRLLLSRMRLLCNHGFFGLLLMHMVYTIDEGIETACTDGARISFSPAFLETLNDSESDFVMMHEVLHVALRHCFRRDGRDREQYNVACDIVVNSNILLENNMDLRSITLRACGPAMHLAPDGNEGHQYTAEQVYEMLPAKNVASGRGKQGPNTQGGQGKPGQTAGKSRGKAGQKQRPSEGPGQTTWDDHSRWDTLEDDDTQKELWDKWIREACESITVREASNGRGLLPAFARRLLKEWRTPQTDWRAILNDFVQEEVTDYSFTPPDRRFDGSPFFLPDFNEKEDVVANILFMVDTSASMSDEMVVAAYSEIKGAIDQFGGKLKGWLGLFDAAVIEPKPFDSVEALRAIHPAGGGGTDFRVIFQYVERNMNDPPPASIIILTDGYAPVPKETAAMGIPVLWLLNNEKIDPPWGKVARIKV